MFIRVSGLAGKITLHTHGVVIVFFFFEG